MKEIVFGIICNIIVAFLTWIITKTYHGYKSFKGIKHAARFNNDCFKAGIINVFPTRKTYGEHKDHGTSSEYISRAEHSVLYVGYWLASGTEMGNLKETIRNLTADRKTVSLIFINPYNDNSLLTCSDYIGISSEAIKSRVKTVIKDLLDFKKQLGENSHYLIIKIHEVPLSASAFILDDTTSKKCRILVDYKIYKKSREESYGIEFQDANKVITKRMLDSYKIIANEAKEINNIFELHK